MERLFEFDEDGKSKQGYQFNFFRAVYLLEKLYQQQLSSGFAPPGREGPLNQEPLRFRPGSGLGFPAADVLRIERETGEPVQQTTGVSELIRLTLSFMGLYGVDSRLPAYFSEAIIAEEMEPLVVEESPGKKKETFPLRDFLDIFNHRLYSFFYRSWKKYRYYLQFSPDGKDTFSQYLLSLFGLGLGMESLQDSLGPLTVHLIAYAGFLGQQTRNAEGLRWLLSDYFGGIPVKIVELMPQWVDIDPRYRIPLQSKPDSPPLELGQNTVVGEKSCDYSGKFRVVLGPLNFEAFHRFLPGGANAEALYTLVRFYAPDCLDFDVELVLSKDAVPEVRLGEKRVSLGQSCWLGIPRDDVSVVVSPHHR